MTPTRRRWFRLGFGAAVWVGLLVTVVSSWDEVGPAVVSAGTMFPMSVLLIGVGLLGGAKGWAVLQPVSMRPRSFRAFLAAQPAKYLPAGGAFQAVGQIGLSSVAGGRSSTGVAFLAHGAIQLVAAALVALLLVFDPALPPWVMWAVTAAAVIGVLLLRQGTLEILMGWFRRLFRMSGSETRVPATSDMRRSCGWTLVPLVLSGCALVSLLGLWSSPSLALAGIGSFAASWAVGFLAVPFPSGIGVRELMLVALLPAVPAAEVVGLSIVHRFATLSAELILLAVVSRGMFVSPTKE
jgi:glycosyltransferase 2 family protein